MSVNAVGGSEMMLEPEGGRSVGMGPLPLEPLYSVHMQDKQSFRAFWSRVTSSMYIYMYCTYKQMYMYLSTSRSVHTIPLCVTTLYTGVIHTTIHA